MKRISLISDCLPVDDFNGLGDDPSFPPSDDYGYTYFDPGTDNESSGGNWWGDWGSGVKNIAGNVLKIIDSVVTKPTSSKNSYVVPGSQGNQNTNNTTISNQQTPSVASSSATTIIIVAGLSTAIALFTAAILLSRKKKN